jgi:hypothetical protein
MCSLRNVRNAHWGWPGRCNQHSASSFSVSGATCWTAQHGSFSFLESSLRYSRRPFSTKITIGRDTFLSPFISFFACYFCLHSFTPLFSVNALRNLSTSGCRATNHKSFEEHGQLNTVSWCDSQNCIFVSPCSHLFGHFILDEQI